MYKYHPFVKILMTKMTTGGRGELTYSWPKVVNKNVNLKILREKSL